jgi:hypothetical protein
LPSLPRVAARVARRGARSRCGGAGPSAQRVDRRLAVAAAPTMRVERERGRAPAARRRRGGCRQLAGVSAMRTKRAFGNTAGEP